MYKKIGVVGDKDSVLAFKAIGIDVFSVVEADEARIAVDRMAMNGYAVIFITEQVAVTIEETIERYNKQMLPAVILIPDVYKRQEHNTKGIILSAMVETYALLGFVISFMLVNMI